MQYPENSPQTQDITEKFSEESGANLRSVNLSKSIGEIINENN